MKNIPKYLAYALTLYSLNAYQLSHANDPIQELGRINLELSGIVTTATCGVLSSEQEKYIDLGTVTSKSLASAGSQSTPVPIHFEMSNCPPNGTVTLMFDGARDQENAELLAIEDRSNKAENIAIEISNQDKKRLALGEKNDSLHKKKALAFLSYV